MLARAKYHSAVSFTTPSFLNNAMIIIAASIVLALISQISINFQPVPLTLQSAAVVLLGLTLGSRRAAGVVALYLLEGAAGLPVFAGGAAGPLFLIGPSAGYLWGFLPAAFCAGWLMEHGMAKNIYLVFATALIATVIIFLFGVAHLQMSVGWNNAYNFGVKPFLMTEPVKLIVASMIAQFCWKR